MKKKGFLVILGDFIAKFKYAFLILFLALSVFCFTKINDVDINENITSYLPNNTETKIGLDLMGKEFGALNTIKVMVSDVDPDLAIKLKTGLSEIENVDSVLYTGDENSYKDNKALYVITVSDLSDDEMEQLKLDIDSKIENEYVIYSDMFENTTDGISTALLLAVIIIVIILLITSKTYFEPVIAFIIFGISILLNMGTNFLFGEISYITKSIAVILQLALSIDYVIIFMNQFMKEIGDTPDRELAIKKTITKSMSEICASSLTTISGLLALLFMQLKIGGDIGLVLSKGILCSLLTVILMMPSLLSIFTNIIIKLKKKEKEKNGGKIGDCILKIRKVTLPVFVILIILGVILIPNYHYVYNAESAGSIKTSKNVDSLKKIEDEFGISNTLVVLVKNEEKNFTKELQLVNTWKEFDKISSVTSIGSYEISEDIYLGTEVNYLEFSQIFKIDSDTTLDLYKFYANVNNQLEKLSDPLNYRISIVNWLNFLHENQEKLPLEDSLKEQINTYYMALQNSYALLESDSYTRFLLNLDVPLESEETYELIEDIRNSTDNYYSDVTLVGNTINAMDLESSFTSDNLIITGITILFIVIILLFTFKSFMTTALLIITIEGSILINFGLVSLLDMKVFFMAYVVVSAIQMGATIDYAIVMASRYHQLRQKVDKEEAMVGTLNDSLPAIITSGLILLISGFLIGFVSTSPVISSIGLFLGIGTLISLMATILCLPAILYLFDKLIVKKSNN